MYHLNLFDFKWRSLCRGFHQFAIALNTEMEQRPAIAARLDRGKISNCQWSEVIRTRLCVDISYRNKVLFSFQSSFSFITDNQFYPNMSSSCKGLELNSIAVAVAPRIIREFVASTVAEWTSDHFLDNIPEPSASGIGLALSRPYTTRPHARRAREPSVAFSAGTACEINNSLILYQCWISWKIDVGTKWQMKLKYSITLIKTIGKIALTNRLLQFNWFLTKANQLEHKYMIE